MWSVTLAAMFLPKALVILCFQYIKINVENGLSNKGGLFLGDGAKYPSGFCSAKVAQMGIECTPFKLYS